jgi:hypothetical protein
MIQRPIIVLSTILALSLMLATSVTLVAMAKTSAETTTTTTPKPKSTSTTSTTTTTVKTTDPIDKSKPKITDVVKPKQKSKSVVPVKHVTHHKKKSIVKGSADYQRRYKMGWNLSCSDDMKETKLKATAPHSKAFLDGYRDSRTGDGPCPF